MKEVEMHTEDKHAMSDIIGNSAISRESSASDTNREDDENDMDGVLPLSSDIDLRNNVLG